MGSVESFTTDSEIHNDQVGGFSLCELGFCVRVLYGLTKLLFFLLNIGWKSGWNYYTGKCCSCSCKKIERNSSPMNGPRVCVGCYSSLSKSITERIVNFSHSDKIKFERSFGELFQIENVNVNMVCLDALP
jgi:hypothetical protein